MLARLWPGLDVLGPSQYVDLPAVRTVSVVVIVAADDDDVAWQLVAGVAPTTFAVAATDLNRLCAVIASDHLAVGSQQQQQHFEQQLQLQLHSGADAVDPKICNI